jgi:basic amino acid/polyamine antiporter, APA family
MAQVGAAASDAGEVVRPGEVLPRVLSRWEVLALAINGVVGSGVYLLPAAAAAHLGAASVWAVPFAGLTVALVQLCFVEAGSRFDQPGGAYVYTRAVFGEAAGFAVGWMSFFGRVTAVATLSAGFAQALGYLVPAVREGPGRALCVGLPLVALVGINVRGVKLGAGTVAVLLAAKLVPLGVVIAAGLPALEGGRFAGIFAFPAAGLAKAGLLLLFAYGGFENTAAPAGEYRDARRDVPFALLFQILAVTILYAAVQIVAVGTLPDLAASRTPLADAAGRLIGPRGGALLTVGAALSIVGTIASSILAGPRYLYAISAGGALPPALAALHPRWRTPWVGIALLGALALPLALTGTFVQLAALSAGTRLITYLGTAAAVPFLRRLPPAGGTVVALPGGPAIPIAAIAVCLLLLIGISTRDLVSILGALGAGMLVHGLWRLRRRARVA